MLALTCCSRPEYDGGMMTLRLMTLRLNEVVRALAFDH